MVNPLAHDAGLPTVARAALEGIVERDTFYPLAGGRTVASVSRTIVLEPELPDAAPPASFFQTVRLVDAGATLAVVRWTALPNQPGVALLLDARADPPREGHGTAALDAAVVQMRRHAALTGSPLRRAIALVNQPQVVARAWLHRRGFVHVKTLEDLAREAEAMILVRTFD